MAIGVERRNLMPLVVLEAENGQQELALDVLNAAYEGLAFAELAYDTFQVTSSEEGTPDAIAYRFYGKEELWWLICTFNGIIDPYTELVAGLKLRIPKLDEVFLFINENRARAEQRVASLNQRRVGDFGEL